MSFERIEPDTWEWDAFYANHIHRYRFAAQELTGGRCGRILDAACGVGYGTRHLAAALGTEVVGIDRDERALAIANSRFLASGVHFLADDCETLVAARRHAPFDAVVSFETLEHLKQPERFLRGVFEVLSPDGVTIVSVPNGDVHSSADWEFHARDFHALDLQEILASAGFRHLRFYGQHLNALGRLREQVRAEVHRMRSNPFFRVGVWLQERIRHHRLLPALPEQLDDFEIVPSTPREIREQGTRGPFVIVAVAAASSH